MYNVHTINNTWVYMYTCMHAYMYVYIYIYIHIYMYTHIWLDRTVVLTGWQQVFILFLLFALSLREESIAQLSTSHPQSNNLDIWWIDPSTFSLLRGKLPRDEGKSCGKVCPAAAVRSPVEVAVLVGVKSLHDSEPCVEVAAVFGTEDGAEISAPQRCAQRRALS